MSGAKRESSNKTYNTHLFLLKVENVVRFVEFTYNNATLHLIQWFVCSTVTHWFLHIVTADLFRSVLHVHVRSDAELSNDQQLVACNTRLEKPSETCGTKGGSSQ